MTPARHGSGRKPLSPDEPTVPVTIKLPASVAQAIVARKLRPQCRAAIIRVVKRAESLAKTHMTGKAGETGGGEDE